MMRRGLYFFLMVVLVLRGLAGTAMAAGVLPPVVPTGAQQAQGHSHAPSHAFAPAQERGVHEPVQALDAQMRDGDHSLTSHHDHDEHAAADSPCDGSSAGCATHDPHSTTCSACEICHSAMLDAAVTLTPAPLPTGTLLPVAVAQFDSAPAALVIKPPIA